MRITLPHRIPPAPQPTLHHGRKGHTLPPGVPACCGEFDTLHLWIYKDGALVAASPGIIAVSQSAFIAEPENGWYDIWIASDPTYNVAPAVEYEALAEVEYLPKANPVKRLLPDLTFRGTDECSGSRPRSEDPSQGDRGEIEPP